MIEPMKVFWKEKPLSATQHELLGLCLWSHRAVAYRENASTGALLNSGIGSGKLVNGLIGALSTLGGKHAPLRETYNVLISEGVPHGIVPGWGNSFVKDGPDPAWVKVDEYLKLYFPATHARIEEITRVLHEHRGRKVWPNPSCYTAATAISIDLPSDLMEWILIAGRLNAWTEIFGRSIKVIQE